MKLKYCDDHTCYHEENGKCEKCEAGEPGFVRPYDQINPHDTERKADLKRRGLLKPKTSSKNIGAIKC